MAARFPQGKQPEFPVHCIGTRKISNLIFRVDYHQAFLFTCLPPAPDPLSCVNPHGKDEDQISLPAHGTRTTPDLCTAAYSAKLDLSQPEIIVTVCWT